MEMFILHLHLLNLYCYDKTPTLIYINSTPSVNDQVVHQIVMAI